MKKSRMDKRTIYVDWRDAPSATEFSRMLVNAISIEDDHFDLDCEFIERKLNERERKIFRLLVEGHTICDIAKEVGVSRMTIWRDMNIIREKVKKVLA